MRTCDLERARAAASSCLRGVERLSADAPNEADQAQAAASNAAMQAAIAKLLGLASMAAASRWGLHWAMAEEEANAIAAPACEVIESELGAMPDDPWSRLILALGVFALPRLVLQFTGGEPVAPPKSSTQPTVDVTATVTKEKAAA